MFNILPKQSVSQQWKDDHCDYDDSEYYDEYDDEYDDEDDDILDEDLEEQRFSGSYLEPDRICQTDNHGITCYAD